MMEIPLFLLLINDFQFTQLFQGVKRVAFFTLNVFPSVFLLDTSDNFFVKLRMLLEAQNDEI